MLNELLVQLALGMPPESSPPLQAGSLVVDAGGWWGIRGGRLTDGTVDLEAAAVLGRAELDGDEGREWVGVRSASGELVDLETGATLGVPWDCSTLVGDVNGDGLTDLVAAGQVWLSAGPGKFNPVPLETDTDVPGVCVRVYALGDLDRDGLADFARSDTVLGHLQVPVVGGALTLYLGRDSARGVPVWRYTRDRLGPGLALTAADVNGDGDLELVSLGGFVQGSGADLVLEVLDDVTTPDGPRVVADSELGWGSTFLGTALLNVGDVDGDGDDEVAFAMYGPLDSDLIRVLDVEPSGDLRSVVGPPIPVALPTGTTIDDVKDLQVGVGDVDGSGGTDLVVSVTWDDPMQPLGWLGSVAVVPDLSKELQP